MERQQLIDFLSWINDKEFAVFDDTNGRYARVVSITRGDKNPVPVGPMGLISIVDQYLKGAEKPRELCSTPAHCSPPRRSYKQETR